MDDLLNNAPCGFLTFAEDGVVVPMRQRSRYEDEILQAKKAAEEAIGAKGRAYRELQAWAEREALLNRIGQALRRSTDPSAIQDAAVRVLGEALPVDRCWF